MYSFEIEILGKSTQVCVVPDTEEYPAEIYIENVDCTFFLEKFVPEVIAELITKIEKKKEEERLSDLEAEINYIFDMDICLEARL